MQNVQNSNLEIIACFKFFHLREGFNVDLSRLQSTQTSLFKQLCNDETLISVHIQLAIKLSTLFLNTFCGVTSPLDHFVISNELPDCIKSLHYRGY